MGTSSIPDVTSAHICVHALLPKTGLLARGTKASNQRLQVLTLSTSPLHSAHRDGRNEIKCIFALFHTKARSGMQFPHTTGKGKMAGSILPDLGISVPEMYFLHHMLMALGGFTLSLKAESCTCIARDKFSTMSQSRTQLRGA